MSLTFDDGTSGQLDALPILQSHGMAATFYVNSGMVGADGYLTEDDLHTLAQAGNEIGGHTITHAELPIVSKAEAMHQICNDRVALGDMGLEVTSFAYPFAALDNKAKQAVEECGYNSARNLGDIHSTGDEGGASAYAESIPAEDPYVLKAPNQYDKTWTLRDLQDVVIEADEHGDEDGDAGWVPFTFHGVGTGGELSITPRLLRQFVAWLEHNDYEVQTVDEVVGGHVKPYVQADEPPPGPEKLSNTSLEEVDGNGQPVGWLRSGYGDNTATWTDTSDARSGAHAQRVDVSDYVDGHAILIPRQDVASYAPKVEPGNRYTLSAWYKSNGTAQIVVYVRIGNSWSYWDASPWLDEASRWTRAEYVTPPMPANAEAISFGIALISDGWLTTDDYGFSERDD